jgi:hypothetical protein
MTSRSAVAVSRSLVSGWVERVREILPADEFDVDARGTAFSIAPRHGDGRWGVTTPIIMLSLPGSPREKLVRTYRMLAESIPEMICEVRGEQWPGQDPQTHVSVGSDQIDVWWESAADPDATVRLRPIPRAELGI